MNILESKVNLIEQKYDDLEKDMFRHIEKCGRNCYKSEDRITDDSYKKFVENLMNLEHGAMLEHGTVYLRIPLGTPFSDSRYMSKIHVINFFERNSYSKVIKKEELTEIEGISLPYEVAYITTNYRVIYDNRFDQPAEFTEMYKATKYDFIEYIKEFIVAPTPHHKLRHTVEFTYTLAVARDVNRHRVQSVAEESTRYCDYTKEKFGAGLNIIPPERFTIEEAQTQLKLHQPKEGESLFYAMISDLYDGTSDAWTDIDWWIWANVSAEYSYHILKNQFGWSNQECSLVLPLDTKTCSIHTAFDEDWIHFFNLRALGTTGAPRPSIKKLALRLMNTFINNGWVDKSKLDQKYLKRYEESLLQD